MNSEFNLTTFHFVTNPMSIATIINDLNPNYKNIKLTNIGVSYDDIKLPTPIPMDENIIDTRYVYVPGPLDSFYKEKQEPTITTGSYISKNDLSQPAFSININEGDFNVSSNNSVKLKINNLETKFSNNVCLEKLNGIDIEEIISPINKNILGVLLGLLFIGGNKIYKKNNYKMLKSSLKSKTKQLK